MNVNANNQMSVQEQLTVIAKTAISSSDNSKSGGGYMGLWPAKDGTLRPVKFLTHHSERGCHFDRTIIKNSMRPAHEMCFSASEALERTLLDLAAQTSEAAKNEVQDLFASWRKKSAYEGKTFLSRETVFKAVKAINAKLEKDNRVDLSSLKGEKSVADTTLRTQIVKYCVGDEEIRDKDTLMTRILDGGNSAAKYLETVKGNHASSAKVRETLEDTKNVIKYIYEEVPENVSKNFPYSNGGSGTLSFKDIKLLATIRSWATLSANEDIVGGPGYMGLTLSDGALVPINFLTHDKERGGKTDKSIMKSISKEAEGDLAFKSSELLETVLQKLADKAGKRASKSVRTKIADWKAKSAYNGKALLSRKVVLDIVFTIADAAASNSAACGKMLDYPTWQPTQSDTRINQLCSLDAKENLKALADLLKVPFYVK